MDIANLGSIIVNDLLRPILKEAIQEEIRAARPSDLPPEVVEIELIKRQDYLAPKEVEKIYRLNANTLAQWRSQGRGPAYSKDGEVIRYRKKDIEDYMQSNRIRTRDQKN